MASFRTPRPQSPSPPEPVAAPAPKARTQRKASRPRRDPLDRRQRDSARRRRIRERGGAEAEPLARLGELTTRRSCARENAALQSDYRALLASPRIQPQARAKLGLVYAGSVRLRIHRPREVVPRQAGKPPHPPPARGLRTRLRRHACPCRLAAGRAGRARSAAWRRASTTSRSRSRPAAARSSTARRPARDRRADDDRLCRPAPGREAARSRARGAPLLGVDAERALPSAPEQEDELRLRAALRRPEGGCRS